MIHSQPDVETHIELQAVPARLFPQLVRLHQAVFPAGQVAGTIFAGKGVARYLSSLVAFPSLQPEHVFWGARQGKDLIGYAHCRALPESWHLNNIAVLPEYQGQGIGRRLWQQFIESGRQRQFRQITLDVESDNQPAVDWYRRQGLDFAGAVWRYEKRINAIDRPEAERMLRLIGWDQAEAWQAIYGFSQFQIHRQEKAWTIGRIGERYFRSGSPLPDAIETALAQIDPSRRLLIFSGEPLTDPDITLLGKSLRMSGPLP